MTTPQPIKTATAFAISIHIVALMKTYLHDQDQRWLRAVERLDLEKLRRGGMRDARDGNASANPR